MTATATKTRGIHLSKTTWATWAQCRRRYFFEKVAKAERDESFEEGSAGMRGTAAHEAAAAILLADKATDPSEAAEAVLQTYLLDDNDRERLTAWAVDAATFTRGLDGDLRWVETLLSAEFRGLTLWAKFDAVVVSRQSGIEVVDFTFGSKRCTSEEGLLAANGTKVYRLVAGACERDQTLRPIRITEFHVPSGEVISVTPTDDDVRVWFREVHQVADSIREARSLNLFPANPGPHCGWCAWREQCPDGGLLLEPPL